VNRWMLLVAGCVAVLSSALAVGPHLPHGSDPPGGIILIGVAWVAFGVGVWLLPRTAQRAGVMLVLAGAVALVVAAGFGPPRSSDDLYRYLWDGRVQAEGIDPYRYAPAAPELVELRDPYLWPSTSNWCVPPGAIDTQTGEPLEPGCTLINRPTVHTIYPPAAQGLFLGVELLSPPGTEYRGIRLLGAAAALGTTVLLMWGLRRTGRDPRRAALWAWCPAVALEGVADAHIDVVAAGLVGAAMLVLAGLQGRRTAVGGGLLLGLAIAVKFTPIAVLPATLRRFPFTTLASVSTVVGLLYLPHLLAVGSGVVGYLGGYAQDEGYADGRRFALLPVSGGWALALAAVVIACVTYATWRSARPEAPWHAAALSTGTLLLLTTPAYPWYALMLVVLAALGARAEWLAVVAAGYLAQRAGDVGLAPSTAQFIAYGIAGTVVVACWLLRRERPARVSPASAAA
jgi:hypothetical protein